MAKVSIIVPVYNVERYLGRCLDSLLGQTLEDLEVICVDDGSVDGSGAILDGYARRDARIRVTHQANGGVSVARNTGLALVTSPYVMFCDPDDWAESTWCEELHGALEKNGADFAVARAFIDGECPPEQRKMLEEHQRMKFSGVQDVRPEMFEKIDHGLWIYIFRVEQLRRYGIDFLKGMRIGEDWLFCKKVLVTSRTACFLDRRLYHYVQRSGSALNGKTSYYEMDLDFIRCVMCLYDFLVATGTAKAWREEYFGFFLSVGGFDVQRSGEHLQEFYGIADRFLAHVRPEDIAGLPFETRAHFKLLRRHKVHLLRTQRYKIGPLTIAKLKYTPICVKFYVLGITVYKRSFV